MEGFPGGLAQDMRAVQRSAAQMIDRYMRSLEHPNQPLLAQASDLRALTDKLDELTVAAMQAHAHAMVKLQEVRTELRTAA